MDPVVLIGILGSVASIVSLFLAKPELKSQILHIVYSVLVVSLASSAVIYNGSIREKLQQATSETKQLQERVGIFESRAKEAKQLLDAKGHTSQFDVGQNRGFILSGLTFLEKNRDLFPDTYNLAKKMVSEGVRVTEFAGSVSTQAYYDEQKRMTDGADAMASILRGIAQ
jgi:hypothetical protein